MNALRIDCTNLFIDRGAKLTIIAASGSGPDHGLPGVSKPRAPRPTLRVGRHTFVAVEHPRQDIESSKWSTRGWTYQEVLLSSRRLVFTDSQVYFQCTSSYTLEGWENQESKLRRNSRLRLVAFPELLSFSKSSQIYETLQEYYGRQLSYNSDVLNAFAGIFRVFQGLGQHTVNASHFYGIPIIPELRRPTSGNPKITQVTAEVSFGLGLAWKVLRKDSGFGSINELSRQVSHGLDKLFRLALHDNPFPSWTWAAFKASQLQSDLGRLHFPFRDALDDDSEWTNLFSVTLRHHSGRLMTLSSYLRQDDNYTKFDPMVQIQSLVIPGFLYGETVSFSAFPNVPIHLHQTPESIRGSVTGVCIGYAGVPSHRLNDYPSDEDYVVVILVEELESKKEADRTYRLVGSCSCRTPWPDLRRNTGRRVKSSDALLRMSSGMPWSRRTLRLV
jgi:hypothetical protein